VIPFGPWRPDQIGVNLDSLADVNGVYPAPTGYAPVPSLVSLSAALADNSRGASAVFDRQGNAKTFVGTTTKLYRLDTSTTTPSWDDVSRLVGGNYAVPAGTDKWRFLSFGDLAIALQVGDVPQKFDMISGTKFQALGGSPPKARYGAVIGDFVVLASLDTSEFTMHWSGLNDAEEWTPGANSSDTQEMADGGPIKGLVPTLGTAGYVFQSQAIRRMLFQPGSGVIFQFDKIEDARGLLAPESLVQVGTLIFYLADDGFYRLTEAGSVPIGAKEVSDWFFKDVRADMAMAVDGAPDPINQRVLWSYVSKDNATEIPDRVLIYDWALNRFSKADLSIRDLLKWATPGYNLDTLDAVGPLDSLLYSLDSPIWVAGRQVVGAIDVADTLSVLAGAPLEARLETNDFMLEGARTEVAGLTPVIDAETITARISVRERMSASVTWSDETAIEDTGVIPFHHTGRFTRARVTVAAGQSWTIAQGLVTETSDAGSR
jgi:hypothetical protein